MLDMFDRKVLRTINGIVCVDVEWRTRLNQELYSLYKVSQITKNYGQNVWLGYLTRINDYSVAKRVFDGNS